MHLFSLYQKDLKDYVDTSTHIILKLGTNLLTRHLSIPDTDFFKQLIKMIVKIQSHNKHVIIVSSGAVGMGMQHLDVKYQKEARESLLIDRQAFAALGQPILMNCYREIFSQANISVAQLLLSHSDFHSNDSFKNIYNTLEKIFSWNIIPIINENDTVATEELKFGDNDVLAATIANLYPKALLIILTIVDGFYMGDKRQSLITEITDTVRGHAGEPTEAGGIGGMITKLNAAKLTLEQSQTMVIVDGTEPTIIADVLSANEVGTWFYRPRGHGTYKPVKL